jgi:hypothetical protein
MTQAELDQFLSSTDPVLDGIESKNAVSSNIYIGGKNFVKIQAYLRKLKGSVSYINSVLNVNGLLSSMLNTLQTSKSTLTVKASWANGEVEQQTSNSMVYSLKRVDDYQVEITNLTNNSWNVDSMFVFSKKSDGTQVLPVISTLNGKVVLYYTDGITDDYKVYFI